MAADARYPVIVLPNGDLVVTTARAPQYMRAAFEVLWRIRQRRLGMEPVAPPRPVEAGGRASPGEDARPQTATDRTPDGTTPERTAIVPH